MEEMEVETRGRKKGTRGKSYKEWMKELEDLTIYERVEEYEHCILYKVLRKNKELGYMVQKKNGKGLMGVDCWFSTTRRQSDDVVERVESDGGVSCK